MDQLVALVGMNSASGGTSLITYYIKSVSDIWLAINKLSEEQGTASCIKSKSVRKDVISAIKSAIYALKNYHHEGDDNGLVICSGIANSYL